MLDYKSIEKEIINKHKHIDDYVYLNKYINFLLSYKLNIEDDTYTEKHHILPSSTFPDFKYESWNIIELSYRDHRLVHLWLFKSINIRKYQRPLNWMMSYYKNKKETSNAAKKSWVTLKQDKDKYDKWCEKKSLYMKSLTSEEQRRRISIFWNKMTDDDHLKFSNKMKSYWTDEKRIEKSNSMNLFYSNVENRIKKSIETKKRWDSLSSEEYLKIKEKMNIVNKDERKRKLAGDKIRELWKDDNYLKKMKQRNTNPGVKVKLINTDGSEIIFENMRTMTEKYNFSPHLIRKYRDKKIKILKKDLKEENIILLDCIIESIKNIKENG